MLRRVEPAPAEAGVIIVSTPSRKCLVGQIREGFFIVGESENHKK